MDWLIATSRPNSRIDVLVLTWLCRLEDLVAHEDIINILTNLIDNDNLPHLLLYGPPGTGKVWKISVCGFRPMTCTSK